MNKIMQKQCKDFKSKIKNAKKNKKMSKSKLDELICIKCGTIIAEIADGGGSTCYQCPKCHARYCHGLKWEMYDDKGFEWKQIK